MFTSSFACTPSPASAAITSLAFMFDEVPEPVWKTSIGNWSSSSPFAIRSPAAAMRSALSASSSPSSAFTRAAAALIRPSQRATGAGIGSPETGKLSTALRGLAAPQLLLLDRCRSRANVRRLAAQPASSSSSQRDELHPRPPERLAAPRSARRSPPSPRTRRTARRARRAAPRASPSRGCCELPGARVGEQLLDGLRGVLLVRADHAARAALDPARAVRAGSRAASTPALVVRDLAARRRRTGRPAARRPGSRRCGTRGRRGSSRARPVGRRDDAGRLVLDELVAHDLDRLDLSVAEDRDRRA